MRTVAFAALVASAAAFAPMATPALRGNTAMAAMDKSGRAPVITVFDHRGCSAHANKEYTGPKANSMEDEQCVKVQSIKINGPDADTVLRDSLATLKKGAAFQSFDSAARSIFGQSNTAMAAMDKSGRAPVITVFDHRGCSAHANKEYTGPKANAMED